MNTIDILIFIYVAIIIMLAALLMFVDLRSMAPIAIFLILFFIVLTVVATIASINFHKQIRIVARLYNGDKTKSTCFLTAVYKDALITSSAKNVLIDAINKMGDGTLTKESLNVDGITACDAAAIVVHYTACIA